MYRKFHLKFHIQAPFSRISHTAGDQALVNFMFV